MTESIDTIVKRTGDYLQQGLYANSGSNLMLKFALGKDQGAALAKILGNYKFTGPLNAAFNEFEPFPDEICLYVYKKTVLTNHRLFLIENGALARPPVNLADIDRFEEARLTRNEKIELSNGEVIEREFYELDAKVMASLIRMAKDPSANDLHVAVQPNSGDDSPSDSQETAKDTKAEIFGLIAGLAAFLIAFFGFGADEAFNDNDLATLLVYGVGAGAIGIFTKSSASKMFARDLEQAKSGDAEAEADTETFREEQDP